MKKDEEQGEDVKEVENKKEEKEEEEEEVEEEGVKNCKKIITKEKKQVIKDNIAFSAF